MRERQRERERERAETKLNKLTFVVRVYLQYLRRFFCVAVLLSEPELTCAVRVQKFVNWCFQPSQPQRIISRLTETFIKRYIVDRTNKKELRSEEQSEKAESCRENLWNEIQLKGP